MPKITNQEEFEDFFFGLDTNPTMENGFTSRNDLSKIENKIEAMGLGAKGQDEKGKDIVIGPGATGQSGVSCAKTIGGAITYLFNPEYKA